MKFCHVTISVISLDESLKFYQDIIGLSLRRKFSASDFDIAFLGNGETEIELIYSQANKTAAIGPGISLGFEVESIPEVSEFLRQKNIEPGEVIPLGTQARCLFISDPNGIRVQLVEYL